jgi:transcriptional regulator with XRE-family HTH domain
MVLVDSAPCAAMVETTYTQRLAAALDVPEDKKLWNTEAREKALALASELGVSRQAVEKFFRDESGSMSAENNSRAARFLRVDPDWLATGEGDMRSARAWPFGSALTPAEFFLLEAEDVRPAIDVLLAAVARRRSSGKHQNAA